MAKHDKERIDRIRRALELIQLEAKGRSRFFRRKAASELIHLSMILDGMEVTPRKFFKRR